MSDAKLKRLALRARLQVERFDEKCSRFCYKRIRERREWKLVDKLSV